MFSTTSNIIISNLIKFFLILSIDWFTFSKKHSIWGNNTILFRLSSNNFKFNRFEVSSDNEKIAFFYWSIGVFEIWNKECFCKVSCNSFNSILKRKYMYLCEIGYLTSSSDLNNITESNSEIFSDIFVHSDFSLFKFIIN